MSVQEGEDVEDMVVVGDPAVVVDVWLVLWGWMWVWMC